MITALAAATLLLAQVDAPQGYSYAVASIEAANDLTPTRMLGAWHEMMVERSLEPDVVDHRAAAALGGWMDRPHVCNGRVRYHAAVEAQKSLRLVVVAECYGTDVALERAVRGLTEELAKRMGGRNAVKSATVQDVPERLWRLRSARGGAIPADMQPPPAVQNPVPAKPPAEG